MPRFPGDGQSLRKGDWVEVKSAEEILSTLDGQGCQDNLPFMPEMLQYCGKRFRVYKSAHKTCDTLQFSMTRRMSNAVHLEGLRCDGHAHGGCEAKCLLFWKKSWLTKVSGPVAERPHNVPAGTSLPARSGSDGCNLDTIQRATQIEGDGTGSVYRCQATEMFRATTPMVWWDPRQYLKDLYSGNVNPLDFIRYTLIAAFNMVMRMHWRLHPYPHVQGRATGKTPSQALNLQAGELVQVRSKDEIMDTLNEQNRNRGLFFDVEMIPYCGKTFRVHSRVEKIVNEDTGKLIRLPSPCVILDGVMCSGCLSYKRLFCPRSIYSFWHEVWLRRVD